MLVRTMAKMAEYVAVNAVGKRQGGTCKFTQVRNRKVKPGMAKGENNRNEKVPRCII